MPNTYHYKHEIHPCQHLSDSWHTWYILTKHIPLESWQPCEKFLQNTYSTVSDSWYTYDISFRNTYTVPDSWHIIWYILAKHIPQTFDEHDRSLKHITRLMKHMIHPSWTVTWLTTHTWHILAKYLSDSLHIIMLLPPKHKPVHDTWYILAKNIPDSWHTYDTSLPISACTCCLLIYE